MHLDSVSLNSSAIAGIEMLGIFGEMEHKLLLLELRMLGFREFSG